MPTIQVWVRGIGVRTGVWDVLDRGTDGGTGDRSVLEGIGVRGIGVCWRG